MRLVERPVPEPGAGEVRVRVAVSGVNPTDWKARRGGSSVSRRWCRTRTEPAWSTRSARASTPSRVGERVWLWEAAGERADGTAQEYVALPARQAVQLAGRRLVRPRRQPRHPGADRPPLPDRGRARAATGSRRARWPGATVLVAGGAGAVGHAAIQLARWAGADGDRHRQQRREGDAWPRPPAPTTRRQLPRRRCRRADPRARPGGVDIVVEVAPAANARAGRARRSAPNAVVAVMRRTAAPTSRSPSYALMGPQHPLPVRAGLHRAGGRQGRGGRRRLAAPSPTARCRSARRPACRCTASRWSGPRTPTTRSRAARSARC